MVNPSIKNNLQKNSNPRIGVIGSGSWATAIVKIITDNGFRVRWWIRSQESIDHIQQYGHNPKYLRSIDLNLKKCKLNNNLSRVIRTSDILIVAVPFCICK